MKHSKAVSLAAFVLLIGSTATGNAQDRDHKKDEKREEKVEHAEKKVEHREVRLSAQEQARLIQQQQARAAAYRARLNEQVRIAQQQSALLQQQRRLNEYRAEQQYLADLHRQQQELQTARNYSNDPYFYTAPTYRYTVGRVTRETNQYGAQELRQAVQYGYQQGYRNGRADRQDNYRYDYQDNYAYRDANYGYNGNYVDQSDYNAYFRDGFRRGYEDGYYGRARYGTVSNGSPSILSSLLSSILGLQTIQ